MRLLASHLQVNVTLLFKEFLHFRFLFTGLFAGVRGDFHHASMRIVYPVAELLRLVDLRSFVVKHPLVLPHQQRLQMPIVKIFRYVLGHNGFVGLEQIRVARARLGGELEGNVQ